jgi:hypothetical protein
MAVVQATAASSCSEGSNKEKGRNKEGTKYKKM